MVPRAPSGSRGAIVVALAATACGGGGDSGDDMNKGKADPNGMSLPAGRASEPAAARPTPRRARAAISCERSSRSGRLRARHRQARVRQRRVGRRRTTTSLWTVKLKPGWKFHDGDPGDGQVLRGLLELGRPTSRTTRPTPAGSRTSRASTDVHPEKGDPKSDKMSGLKVVDDDTFTIKLSQPGLVLRVQAGLRRVGPAARGLLQGPEGVGEAPVGNGPYKFEGLGATRSSSRSASSRLQGREQAQERRHRLQGLHDAEAAYSDLRSDNVDWIEQVPPTALTNYKPDLGDRAIEQDVLGDPVDRPGVLQQGVQGHRPQGHPGPVDGDRPRHDHQDHLHGPVSRRTLRRHGVIGYKAGASATSCKFDPNKAKELIKDSGGVPGNKITIQYNADQRPQGVGHGGVQLDPQVDRREVHRRPEDRLPGRPETRVTRTRSSRCTAVAGCSTTRSTSTSCATCTARARRQQRRLRGQGVRRADSRRPTRPRRSTSPSELYQDAEKLLVKDHAGHPALVQQGQQRSVHQHPGQDRVRPGR